MKLKIKQTNNQTYSEVGQVNPLRWKTLYHHGNGEFTDQSGWIKCKDFYNDTVAFFREGTKFSIYNYQNDIKKNDEGVYFLLKYIRDKKSFFEGLKVINHQLRKDLECEVGYWDHDNDEVVLLIPNELWSTTYRISMITMVVRLCNYGTIYKSWEDIWHTDNPAHKFDHAFTPFAIKNAKELGFKVPEQFKKYWWYCGPQHNSEVVKKQTGGTIHNNGVSNWSMFMAQG